MSTSVLSPFQLSLSKPEKGSAEDGLKGVPARSVGSPDHQIHHQHDDYDYVYTSPSSALDLAPTRHWMMIIIACSSAHRPFSKVLACLLSFWSFLV